MEEWGRETCFSGRGKSNVDVGSGSLWGCLCYGEAGSSVAKVGAEVRRDGGKMF